MMRGALYDSIDAFYADDPARERSGERDFGVHWRGPSGADWPTYRISWIVDTGEFYALRLAGDDGTWGPLVELLGTAPDRAAAEDVLNGWAEDQRTVAWARRRIRETNLAGPPVDATADSLKIDDDEGRFVLLVTTDDGDQFRFRFHGVAFEFAESPGLVGLLDWAAQGQSVRAVFSRLRGTSLDCNEGGHERCAEDGCVCECHALASDDPEHPLYADRMLAAGDTARKAERERA